MSATLCKKERLSSFKEIQALMKNGETLFHYPFKVIWQNVLPQAQAGSTVEQMNAIMVSVPKKHFKRAVKRNLLKRRIRESYRLNKGILVAPQEGKTNILFIYVSKEILEFSYIERKLKDILHEISGHAPNGRTPESEIAHAEETTRAV